MNAFGAVGPCRPNPCWPIKNGPTWTYWETWWGKKKSEL